MVCDRRVDQGAHCRHVTLRILDRMFEVAALDQSRFAQPVEDARLGLFDIKDAIQLDHRDAPLFRQRPLTPGAGFRRCRRRLPLNAGAVDDDVRGLQHIVGHAPRFLETFENCCIDGEVGGNDVEHVADRDAGHVGALEDIRREDSALASHLVEIGPRVEQCAAVGRARQNREHRDSQTPGDSDHRVDCRNHGVVAADPQRLRVPANQRVDGVGHRRRVVGIGLEQGEAHLRRHLASFLHEDQ